MDTCEYTTLVAALADVPDPRHKRGQRYTWELLLLLIGAALVSGQQHGRGIGQWVREHADALGALLDRPGQPLPSEATLRRALRLVDPVELEQRLSAFTADLAEPAAGEPLHGQALDGKEVRGSRAHGRIVHLLGLVRHDGCVLAQTAVTTKSNEITAAPGMVAEHAVAGTVTTMDALLAQRDVARQIRQQGGHYLMVIKENQPETRAAIAELFAVPPWLPAEREQAYARHRTVEPGHGRLETRMLEASPALNAWLDWPGVGQVLRRTTRRVQVGTGVVSEEVSYAITSLEPEQATPAQLAAWWRGHWTIENRLHWVRDVTMGEDAGQAYCGATPQALAALRNATISLLRARGWIRIADALRHYGASVHRALTLIGAVPAGL